MLCRPFGDKPPCMNHYAVAGTSFARPTTEPPSHPTVIVFNEACLFTYSKEVQNQVPEAGKDSLYNVIRFSYITQFMKLCHDSFLQLK